MSEQSIFRTIENAKSSDTSRALLVDFLKSKLSALSESNDEVFQAAYEIAGLMATTYAQHLSDTDPIDEILTIAGELETKPENADELRKELSQKISNL